MSAMAALGEHYGRSLSGDLIELYVKALGAYTEDDLVRACGVLLRGEWFPKVCDFIRVLEGESPSVDDLASLRWDQIKAWAWGKGDFPGADHEAVRAFSVTCDAYMLRNADERDLRSYGFSFRSAYRAGSALEKQRLGDQDLLGPIDPSVQNLISGIGRIPEGGGR